MDGFSELRGKKIGLVSLAFLYLFIGCTVNKQGVLSSQHEKNVDSIVKTYASAASTKVRYQALKAMSREKKPAFLPYLLHGLQEEHWILREEAAHGLGELGDKKALPALIEVLNDSSLLVRLEAINAIAKSARGEDSFLLEAALYDPETNIRENVAYVLGYLGDKKSLPYLLEAIDDPDPSVRRSVVSALGKLGEDVSIGFIIDTLKDSQWEVRKQAAISLGKLGGYQAVVSLRFHMEFDDNDTVRLYSRQAVEEISKNIVRIKCGSKCHTYYQVIARKRSPNEWKMIVYKMRLKDMDWMSEEEIELIINYMLQHESIRETMGEQAGRKSFAKAFASH